MVLSKADEPDENLEGALSTLLCACVSRLCTEFGMEFKGDVSGKELFAMIQELRSNLT
jgi:hypothetical protein